MAELVTRPMEYADIDQILAIEKSSFAVPWSREAMESELRNSAARYMVLVSGAEVFAYAGAWVVIDEGHVTNVAVRPDMRGKGCGKAVLRALIRELLSLDVRYMTLEVRISNTPAISLYKRLGFKKAGVRKGYYEDNREDAYIMVTDRPELAMQDRPDPPKKADGFTR